MHISSIACPRCEVVRLDHTEASRSAIPATLLGASVGLEAAPLQMPNARSRNDR